MRLELPPESKLFEGISYFRGGRFDTQKKRSVVLIAGGLALSLCGSVSFSKGIDNYEVPDYYQEVHKLEDRKEALEEQIQSGEKEDLTGIAREYIQETDERIAYIKANTDYDELVKSNQQAAGDFFWGLGMLMLGGGIIGLNIASLNTYRSLDRVERIIDHLRKINDEISDRSPTFEEPQVGPQPDIGETLDKYF